jgi:hypothetical protein
MRGRRLELPGRKQAVPSIANSVTANPQPEKCLTACSGKTVTDSRSTTHSTLQFTGPGRAPENGAFPGPCRGTRQVSSCLRRLFETSLKGAGNHQHTKLTACRQTAVSRRPAQLPRSQNRLGLHPRRPRHGAELGPICALTATCCILRCYILSQRKAEAPAGAVPGRRSRARAVPPRPDACAARRAPQAESRPGVAANVRSRSIGISFAAPARI